MEFLNNVPIFIQISDLICERILQRLYKPGEAIPSVRELAVSLQVNPNTAMRSIERLSADGIVAKKRGIGYFVTDDALQKIRDIRHRRLCESTLPFLAEELIVLGLDVDTICDDLKRIVAEQLNAMAHIDE